MPYLEDKVKPTVMLIGLGDLGSVTLEMLACEDRIGRIVVGSRNVERGQARCNLARLSAMAQGHAPSISFVPLDLNNQEQVAQVVRREAPDLIFHTATMQTWWLPDLLPPEQKARIKSARYGVWLPVHLTLTMKLMQALRVANYQGFTLTAPYPDVVNCVLGRLSLAPTCGVGNLDEAVPKVRLLAARRLGTPPGDVRVWMVAHHALLAWVFEGSAQGAPPYFLRVEHGGEDVTQAIRADELLFAPYPLTPGPAIHFLTAACAVRLMGAFLSSAESLQHAPAPDGLPGGYPVLVSSAGIRPAPIPGLTLAEAVAINQRSHCFDGIERIEEHGTVVFSAGSVEIMRQALGYDCPRLEPSDIEARANELIARFREFAARYDVRW
jgi:hypothetical protein